MRFNTQPPKNPTRAIAPFISVWASIITPFFARLEARLALEFLRSMPEPAQRASVRVHSKCHLPLQLQAPALSLLLLWVIVLRGLQCGPAWLGLGSCLGRSSLLLVVNWV